ncbi:MAG: hypothetical protein KatS3mg039_0422 [Candidatus Kapaibacterium sp.]|nr:MAG: hypothetical protein KatS3mg039_0422 [Candidatus Kapabacteria bacterium]
MEDDALHAGIILRNKRTELGLSIGDMSRLTGIRAAILEAIEAGSFDVMPMVYMRSFVRRYARALGINERELPPLAETPSPRKVSATATAVASVAPSRRASSAIAIVVAVAVVAGAGYALYLSSESPPPGSPAEPPTSSSQTEAPIETVRTTPSRGLLEYFGSTSSDSLRLEAIATDTAWLSITMDGRRSEQVTLRPGDRRQWSANATIVISIGNAGGVELYRNGERLPPLGKRGEAVRYVRITASDVIPSTSSWSRRRDSLLETLKHQPPPLPSQPEGKTAPTVSPSPSKQVTSQPARMSPVERRRQEILRRAMQSREITPVPPKAPSPLPPKPSSP